MANRFWVTGGTGNWNSTTNWSATSGGASGASVPGSGDTATFNSLSGSGTATLDISPTIQTLTCTGFTGTLAFGTNTISLNSTGTVFTGATTMTVSGTPLIILTNNSATARTITPTLVTEANSISFRITAGTGTVLFSLGAVRNLDFTDGTNPTGYSGALSASVNTTVYGNFKASTGMTQSAGNGALIFAATSGTKTIEPAGVVYDRLFTFDGVGGTWQLLSNLIAGPSPAGVDSIRTTTLNNGTLDLNNFTLTTGLLTSSTATARTLAFGTGKIVITGSNATICNTNTGTNLTLTGSKRIELSYSGGVGTRAISGPQTATIVEGVNLFDYFVTAGTDIVNFNGARGYGTIDFSNGGTSTFTSPGSFANGTLRIFGDLTLNSTMVVGSGASIVQMLATSGPKTITSAGQTLNFPMLFNGIGGSWQLQGALTFGTTITTTLTSGSLILNNYTLTTGIFASSGALARTITFGTGTILITGNLWNTSDVTNLTTDASGTISMNSASTKTFNGGSRTWGKLQNSGAGTLTITGANTFTELNNSVTPAFFVFPAGITTSAYSYTLNGIASNLVSLRSSIPGTQYTLAKL